MTARPFCFLPASVLLVSGLLLSGAFSTHAQIAPFAPSVGKPAVPYENFDLRDTATPASADATRASLSRYRQQQVTTSKGDALTAMKNGLGAARASLAARVPTLRVEASRFSAVPEVVDSASARQFLTADSVRPTEESLRGFLAEHAALYGLTTTEAAGLVKFSDYKNPAGNLSWVGLRQEINGVPVFQGEILAAFNSSGALARTTGNLAVGLDAASLPGVPALTPAQAVSAASTTIGRQVPVAGLTVMSTERAGRTSTLFGGPYADATRTDLVYFPLEPGVATLAYSMVLWDQPRAYLILVDANDGTLLFRKCITQDQTQAATYNVYLDDSPSPLSPTSVLPGQGAQPAGIPRTNVTLIADDLIASPLGWLTDSASGAATTTTGNNADAGLDAVSPDGIESYGRPTSLNRTFTFTYNPPPLGTDSVTSYTATGSQVMTEYAKGAVTNLFFWTNRYHDRLYNLGFTEAARNFQTTNTFTLNGVSTNRGGTGNDAVSAQVHDSSGTDNSNFSTPPDGTPGRMQMYVFPDTSPSRDGALDGEVFLHEMTHGVSNRLHGNGSGLATTQSGGMGEGWSDFYARCILSTADENVDGIFASGGYVTYQLGGTGLNFRDNYYYGIRRFPYVVISQKGGPNNRPFNPLTFADIDPAQINLSDGAYPSSSLVGGAANEVHNIGEVWCSLLLEMRERFIKRLGYADTTDAGNNKVLGGNNRALQIVTDAMKLDVVSPTVIQARDSLIAADNAGFAGIDVPDIRQAFAARGVGAGASTTGTAVVETFSPELALGAVTFTDTLGNNNGVPEPGEDIVINVPVTNVGSVNERANVFVGAYSLFVTLAANGGSGTASINYRVPAAAALGSVVTVPISYRGLYNVVTYNYSLRIGIPTSSPVFNETFNGVTAPALPAGWTTTTETATNGQVGTAWTTVTTPVVDTGNSAFAPDLAGNGTAGGGSSLVSPAITVPATGSAQLSFKQTYSMEPGYDGGVLEISIAGAAYTDIVTAGGSFTQGGYTGTISTLYKNPLAGRSAWTGAATRAGVAVNLPASASGNSVQFRWRLGFDNGVSATGWNVDTVSLIVITYSAAPIDTDGDGLQNGYELAHGLNPNDPTDAAKDNDGDGMTNLQEYLAGTDPNNASSVLKISQVYLANNTGVTTMNLVVPLSVLGKQYVVQYKNDLTDPAWTTAPGANGNGGDLTLTIYADGSNNLPGRFYRVIIQNP